MPENVKVSGISKAMPMLTVSPGNAPMITPASVPRKIINIACQLNTAEAAARISFMISPLSGYSKKTEVGNEVLKTRAKKT